MIFIALPAEAGIAEEIGTKVEEHLGDCESLFCDTPTVNPQSQANLEELRTRLVDAIGELEE